MGNNPKHKRPDKPVNDKEQEWKFEWRKLFFGAGITLLVALIPYLWNVFKPTPPEFALINPIQRPDSAITIEGQNRAAAKKKNLTVEFDGLKFSNAAILQPNSEPPLWRFVLQGRGIPDSLLRDGRHAVRAGFAGEKLGEPMTVLFNTQAPLVSVEVKQPPGKPNERVLIGRAVSRLPSPADTLSVDIAFNSGGSKPVEMPVPVKRVIEESTGRMYFEFETTVQGLPKISPKDPRYAEPFFALRITDAAGNRQYQEESYAQFTAPGDKRFGATKADIEFKRLPVEVPLKGSGKLDKSGNLKLTFRVTPRATALTQLANGQPAIILRVTSIAGNMRQLDWTNLPDSLRMPQPVTTILRDEQQIGQSFTNQFTDEKAPSNREATYRVEQMARDGKAYGSNNEQAANTRGATITTNPPSTIISGNVLEYGKLQVLALPFGTIDIDSSVQVRDSNVRFVKDLLVGAYELGVAHPKFGYYKKTVNIKDGIVTDIVVDFNRQFYITVISLDETETKAVWGEIYVDGEMIGQTPKRINLRLGKHTIEVRRDGYISSDATTVNLEDDLEQPLKFRLRKKE